MGCLSSKPAGDTAEDRRAAYLASLSPEDLAAEREIDAVFALFAKIDTDKNNGVDKRELAEALEKYPRLKKRLCENTGVTEDDTAADALATKLVEKIVGDADGVVHPTELERAVRGWAKIDYDPVDDAEARDRQNQLKGAAERAKIRRDEHGGFAGVTDPSEARAIGERAQELTRKGRDAAFGDSDPEAFGGGAEFVKSPALKAKRASLEKQFEEELRADKLLNKVGEDFKGHDEATARAQAENVKLGGVEVEIDGEAERRLKKMPERLVKRMEALEARRAEQ
jgi:hypothetical protein